MSRIFIELPTWLGDGVMATPAIENLLKIYPGAQLTVFGSFVSTALFKHHPNIKQLIIDDSKQSGNRLIKLYKTARALGRFDVALSFRSSFASKWLIFCVSAQKFTLNISVTTPVWHVTVCLVHLECRVADTFTVVHSPVVDKRIHA